MEEVRTVVQSYGTQSISKVGFNRPLMQEVLDKLDECEWRLSELLIDSATDESEANSPIKMTPQEEKGEVGYLSRTRKRTMRSKLVIDRINEMKMRLGRKVIPRRSGKTKVDSEKSMKAVNSAKRKRVGEVMDLGQGDDRLPSTDRMLTDVAMVPPILMAGIKSTGYKSKRSDSTLTGAALEMEILSQCGESTMKDFKPSPMNHGKGSVVEQLVPVEYNRLTATEDKELSLTKDSMGALPKSNEYCGPIRKKSYNYVSGVIGIAYNPFLSEDIREYFFDYEQAVLLRFWTSRIATIRGAANPQTLLGLVLEEKVAAPSVPESDKRVEFGLGFSNELLRMSLLVVWELMRPSWCPSPNADSILLAIQDAQRDHNADCNLRDLNIIYKVMTAASKSNGEDKVELLGWGPEDWVKPGSCLPEVCGLDGHVCGSLDCVKTLEKQHKQLTILFGNIVMKA